MITEKEQACAKAANQVRVEELLAEVKALSAINIIKQSPLRFVFDVDKPRSKSGMTGPEFLMLPLVLLYKILIVITFPIYFLIVLVIRLFEKQSLKNDIKALRRQTLDFCFIQYKNLESLWETYGLERREYSNQAKLTLLKYWVEILYCRVTLDSLNLDDRYKSLIGAEARLNAASIVRFGTDWPTFTLAHPIDTLIGRLSEELPVYDEA